MDFQRWRHDRLLQFLISIIWALKVGCTIWDVIVLGRALALLDAVLFLNLGFSLVDLSQGEIGGYVPRQVLRISGVELGMHQELL